MAKRKKTSGKVSWKVWAGLLAVLAVIGIGGSSSKKDASEEPVRAVAAAEPTETPAPTEVPTPTPKRIHGWYADTTVYVSSSGIIHINKDCSGMKHYTEMTLEEADAAGYELCEKCG